MSHSVSCTARFYAWATRPRCILALILWYSCTASGDVIYSGLQNISLQGVPGAIQTWSINVAGGAGSWDKVQFGIAAVGLSSGGSNDIFAGAEVALASSAAIFPRVTRFDYGDPFPSDPMYGSGSRILWGFGYGPADGIFYAAMVLGTFGTGPGYMGWIHLMVENSSTLSATITVIDWAYSNEGAIAMGQVSSVPEPSSSVLFAIGLLAMIAGGLWKPPGGARLLGLPGRRPKLHTGGNRGPYVVDR